MTKKDAYNKGSTDNAEVSEERPWGPWPPVSRVAPGKVSSLGGLQDRSDDLLLLLSYQSSLYFLDIHPHHLCGLRVPPAAPGASPLFGRFLCCAEACGFAVAPFVYVCLCACAFRGIFLIFVSFFGILPKSVKFIVMLSPFIRLCLFFLLG